jgi:hypothetical protein
MQSTPQSASPIAPASNDRTDNRANGARLPLDWICSLLSLPVLGALVGGPVLAKSLRNFGETSEEIFRGERLPLLTFPNRSPSD